MKCVVCGKDAHGKFCSICDPNLDIYNDNEDHNKRRKNKHRDLRRKQARQRKEQEWE